MRKFFHYFFTHKRITFPAVLILVVLIFIFFPRSTKPVDTQTIKRGDITQSLSASGTVDTMSSVDLTFMAGGKVVYLGAKKGDMVQAGQTIAALDQRTTQKNLETALRNYSEQRNTFDQTKDNNQNRTPQTALNDAMARILQNNQYDLDKAIISVELQSLAKEQSVLTTPISGIVTKAGVSSVGVNIIPTTTFSIADPTKLVFKIDIDEADIGNVRQNQPVQLTLDAYPNRTLDLSVDTIDFVTHSTSTGGNAYTVEANLPDNTDLSYRIGMNGNADVILNQKKDVLMIPLASVVDNKNVYIQTPNGFEKRVIKLGLQNDTDAEVVNGLKEGDKVALNPTDAEKVSTKKFPL